MKKVANDLKQFSDYWVVIYGSFISKHYIPNRSDIDVAIITRLKEKQKNTELWKTFWEQVHPPYDIKIFELLPLYIKIEIIKNYKVLFGDDLAISEYFFQYRKLWKDMEFRYKQNQFSNLEEKINLMSYGKP